MQLLIERIVEYISYIFLVSGVLIVTLGGLHALHSFILKEFFIRSQSEKEQFNNKDRHLFARRMILSLEFFLAVDIINTVSQPTWESLGFLASLVIIRSTLTFFLSKEIKGEYWSSVQFRTSCCYSGLAAITPDFDPESLNRIIINNKNILNRVRHYIGYLAITFGPD